MIDFALAHTGAMAVLLLLLVVTGALMIRSESLSLWLLSTWYSLPLIGGIAALARRQNARRLAERGNGPSSAVLALCSSYGRFIRVLNRADYDNYMNYLRKAGDLGIRPFPPYLRGVIFAMILIEAAGLAYVLAGWTLPGASEFAQRIAALGIGFLIAVVLVFFTHWAGLEIDQVNRYRRDRNEWLADGGEGPLFGPDLSLNDAQSVDDREPAYRQRATRGHGKKTYVLTTITLLMVLAVGSGAAFVRGQVLEQEIASETANHTRTLQRFDFGAGPEAAAPAALSAEQSALQDEISIKRRGGWGTLVILMIIFFFLQLLSIFFGYRHSFNGRLSQEAYRALRIDSFSSYNELTQFYDRVADIAQSKVDRLQELLEQRSRDSMGNPVSQTPYAFRDYLLARDAQRRDKPLGAAPEPAVAVPAAVVRAASAAADAVALPEVRGEVRSEARNEGPDHNGVPPATPGWLRHEAPRTAPLELPPARVENPRAPAPDYAALPSHEDDSIQARLDLAEKLERERAAARATRGRAAKRKGSGLVES